MEPKNTDFIDSEGLPRPSSFTFSDVHPSPDPHPDPHTHGGAPHPTLRAGKQHPVKHVKMVGYVLGGWALASVVFGLIFSHVKGGTSSHTILIVGDVARSLSIVGASLMLVSMSYMSSEERRTFHLVLCSSWANLMAAVILIAKSIGQGANFHGVCQMGGIAYQLLSLMKLFWDTLLSVHVLGLFLAPLRYGRRHHLYQIYFHCIGWGCTAFFALIPLVTDSYGSAIPGQYGCWLTGSSVIYFFFLPFAICVIANVGIMAYMTYQLVNPPRVISKDVRLSALVWVMSLALWSTCANIWYIPYVLGVSWAAPLGQLFTCLNGFVHCLIWLPKLVKSMRKSREDKLVRLGLRSPLEHHASSLGVGGNTQLKSMRITLQSVGDGPPSPHSPLSGLDTPRSHSPRAMTPDVDSQAGARNCV